MNYNFIVVSFIFLVIALIHIYITQKHLKLIKLFEDPWWIASFIIITIWCIYVLKFHQQEDKRDQDKLIDATHKAIIAFMIAMLTYLDMRGTVFWLVWIASYYLSTWS